MAQRLVAALLGLTGLVVFLNRPILGFVVLATALAVFLDMRGTFGRGRYRAMISFITGLWLTVVGAVTTFVGMFDSGCVTTEPGCDDPEGNFLFFPGLLLLAVGLTLVLWSAVYLLRTRRAG